MTHCKSSKLYFPGLVKLQSDKVGKKYETLKLLGIGEGEINNRRPTKTKTEEDKFLQKRSVIWASGWHSWLSTNS